jgi:hypothetical protein
MRTIALVVLGLIIFFGFLIFFRPSLLALDTAIWKKLHAPKDDGYGLAKDECLAKGGVFRKPGPSPVEICQIPSTDGGKPCLSGFQCEWGNCVGRLNLRKKVNIVGTGQCMTYERVYGCVNYVSFGLVTRSVCLD